MCECDCIAWNEKQKVISFGQVYSMKLNSNDHNSLLTFAVILIF